MAETGGNWEVLPRCTGPAAPSVWAMMFHQPDIRLDLADQLQRERMAEAERHRLAAQVAPPTPRSPRRSRRVARAVLAFAGGRFFG
jgi:hypothetical protein